MDAKRGVRTCLDSCVGADAQHPRWVTIGGGRFLVKGCKTLHAAAVHAQQPTSCTNNCIFWTALPTARAPRRFRRAAVPRINGIGARLCGATARAITPRNAVILPAYLPAGCSTCQILLPAVTADRSEGNLDCLSMSDMMMMNLPLSPAVFCAHPSRRFTDDRGGHE